nr:MAG TPA: hypothetical protein [Caudoviricetes sp.]
MVGGIAGSTPAPGALMTPGHHNKKGEQHDHHHYSQ